MVEYSICLAGNPNVGKSTIFNNLTGMHQHTGNWAGKTVENAKGEYKYNSKLYKIVDLPGTYSLISQSEEEEIAKNYLYFAKPDCVVIVVDATCLERNLNLVYQILEITKNVIVCVNLLDEANKKGIYIDLKKLQEELGIAVVASIAQKKKSLNRLLNQIEESCVNKQEEVSNLEEVFTELEKEEKAEQIMLKAEETYKKVVKLRNQDYNEKDRKIDKIVTSKIWGIPIMLLFLGLIFWITVIGANYPSIVLSNFFGMIENKLMIIFTRYECTRLVNWNFSPRNV